MNTATKWMEVRYDGPNLNMHMYTVTRVLIIIHLDSNLVEFLIERCCTSLSYHVVLHIFCFFQISVGCNSSHHSSFVNPVHLYYSTDFGVTWDYLVPQCLPGDPQCNGVIAPASVYYLNSGWRRITIPLPEKLTAR